MESESIFSGRSRSRLKLVDSAALPKTELITPEMEWPTPKYVVITPYSGVKLPQFWSRFVSWNEVLMYATRRARLT